MPTNASAPTPTPAEQPNKQKTEPRSAILGATTDLQEFLAANSSEQLDLKDRQRMIDQALILIEQVYVHLPLKRSMHAVDPVQRLKLLRYRLKQMSEQQFHTELLEVFTELRDLHTNYLLPDPYRSKTALLPFLIEEYFEGAGRLYMVSHLVEGFHHPNFKRGVVITHWNGIPIERAVELNAARQAGSNAEARHARGLEAMTIRPLGFTLPPDEEWVMVHYLTDGEPHTIQFKWRVIEPPPSPSGVDPNSSASPASFGLGFDALTETARRVKKTLFAPDAMEAEQRISALIASGALAAEPEAHQPVLNQTSTMPDVFSFKTVHTPSGDFGYIRIWTFMTDDADAFINEFMRILTLLPQDGIILDVRGNGGGFMTAGERLLQLLTPRPIEPARLHLINTPLTLELCERVPPLKPWYDSIAQSVETGATFSYGFPLEPIESYNRLGQQYYGPVVLIVDALCYSTTDIFAAGFQDHGIGFILGTSGNTGAGGANVWTHELLQSYFPATNSPFKPLPMNASLRVALRRTTRVGERAGVPVEELGVVPDEIHRMTRNDLLNDNEDLIGHAAKVLSKLQPHQLNLAADPYSNGTVHIKAKTKNISRLDVYLAGRPRLSSDVTDGETTLAVPVGSRQPKDAEVYAFVDDALVAVKRLALQPDKSK